MQAKDQITNQQHINDYGYACINGYKGTIYEYIQNKYKYYCETCKRCDAEPMSYDEFRTRDY